MRCQAKSNDYYQGEGEEADEEDYLRGKYIRLDSNGHKLNDTDLPLLHKLCYVKGYQEDETMRVVRWYAGGYLVEWESPRYWTRRGWYVHGMSVGEIAWQEEFELGCWRSCLPYSVYVGAPEQPTVHVTEA